MEVALSGQFEKKAAGPKIVQEVHGLPSRRHVILQIVSWAR